MRMVILEQNDPLFVVLEDFKLGTTCRSEIHFEKDDPISLSKDDDNYYIGNGKLSVLKISKSNNKIRDALLKNVVPSSFELSESDEGSFLKPVLLEGEFTIDDVISRVPFNTIVQNNNLLNIVSINF